MAFRPMAAIWNIGRRRSNVAVRFRTRGVERGWRGSGALFAWKRWSELSQPTPYGLHQERRAMRNVKWEDSVGGAGSSPERLGRLPGNDDGVNPQVPTLGRYRQ